MELLAKVERLHAIDAILKDAGGVCAPNAVEDEEGGIVTICLGTFAEAERLNDLLYGGDGKVNVEGRKEAEQAETDFAFRTVSGSRQEESNEPT